VTTYVKCQQTLVFSDTIVITIPFNEGDNILEEITISTIMILAASKLTAQMFMIGLLMRGVIHEGEFITQHNCFAGKAIELLNLIECVRN